MKRHGIEAELLIFFVSNNLRMKGQREDCDQAVKIFKEVIKN